MLSDTSSSNNLNIENLLEKFSTGTARQKRSLISEIENQSESLSNLGASLLETFDPDGDDWAAGWLLQVLRRHQPNELIFLLEEHSGCWFSAPSSKGIDYKQLQEHLLYERYEEADLFTNSILRELAGPEAVKRGYVYFSEVPSIAAKDLETIDRLWTAYSQGKFGFSKQARSLKALGGRYDRLWPRIGWKKDGVWTRYPGSFTWSLEAPEGHMPLVNQLRGVRLMDALLSHPSIAARV